MQLTEKQQQAVDAYERNNCSEVAAARELGIDPKSIRGRLYDAIKKGYPIVYGIGLKNSHVYEVAA